MLTTGVAALCGLIVGWGIRSMRQTSTAQQGASDGLLEARTNHMLNLGLCPDHNSERELIMTCSLPDRDKYEFLVELSLIQSRCKHCMGKVFPREATHDWQRTPDGKLVYRRLPHA